MSDHVLEPIKAALNEARSSLAKGQAMRSHADQMIETATHHIDILETAISALERENQETPPTVREVIAKLERGEQFTINDLQQVLSRLGNGIGLPSIRSMVSRMKADGELISPSRGTYARP